MSNPVPHGWVGSDLENPERAAAWLRELESVTATIAYGGSLSAVSQQIRGGVASRPNTYYNGKKGSSDTSTFRTAHVALVDITSLSLAYGNFYGTSAGAQGDGPGNLSVTCSIEYPLLTTYRGYRNGSRTVTIEPGCVIVFDPIAVVIPKGTVFYVRTYVSGDYPTGIQGNIPKAQGYDNILLGTGSTTDDLEGDNSTAGPDITVSGTITSRNNLPFSPLAFLGTSADAATACVGILGDSIINGSNDITDTGYMYRALNLTIPYLKLCQPGETAQTWAAQGSAVQGRQSLIRYLTHAVTGYGRNDVTASRTLAQIQADLITGWYLLSRAGVRAWQTTLTPTVTTTDGYSTLGNQTTSASNAVRLTVNAWIRDGAPMLSGAAVATGSSAPGTLRAGDTGHPLVGYIELADVVESARDSGKWDVSRVRNVTDAAMTSGTSVLTSATAAFTSADVGAGVWIVGAGSAGADIGRIITKVTNSTTVTVNGNASTTVSGATAHIGIATHDGVHPDGAYHALIAALIPVASFTV